MVNVLRFKGGDDLSALVDNTRQDDRQHSAAS